MQSTFKERIRSNIADWWTYLGNSQHFALQWLRTFLLSLAKFHYDNAFLYAASLTFYSLMSLVPLLALMLGIAKGFGYDLVFQSFLIERFSSHSEAIETVILFAKNLLKSTKSSAIAGIGIVIIAWSVMKVLSHVERAFNHIWKLPADRPLGRKMNDYVSLIILAPLGLLLANSLTLYLSNTVVALGQEYALIESNIRLILLILSIAPLGMICLLLAWLYFFMPNTAINFKSALVGGIVCGVLFWIFQWAYISFQIGAARYDAIYGSFLAIPLLFFWVYLSWSVVLLGCELSYVHQSRMHQLWELNPNSISHRMKIALMLRITQLCARQLLKERAAMNGREIAFRLMIPLTYVKPLLDNLVRSGILAELRDMRSSRVIYILNRDVHKLTVRYVIETLENANTLEKLNIKPRLIHKIEEYCQFYDYYCQNPDIDLKIVDSTIVESSE